MKVTYAQAYGYNRMLATMKKILELKPSKEIEVEIRRTIRNKKQIDLRK